MGTSATIIFKDEYEDKFFVNRGSDGFPDVVLSNLKEIVERKKSSWSGSESGLLVSSFVSLFTDNEERLPNYMMAHGVRGDDCYQYYVTYNKVSDKWEVNYGFIPSIEKTKEKLVRKDNIVCQECFSEIEEIGENRYWCDTCDNPKEVSIDVDDVDFKINQKYANIVFKIEQL